MSNFIANRNKDTKVRYITSSHVDAPSLNSEYGSLVKVLKTVLTEGFNSKIVLSITRDPTSKLATVNLPLLHNFQYDQVVQIEGCLESEFNKDFRVMESSSNYIKIYVEGDESLTTATAGNNISVKTAPLGFQTVFENASKSIMCFKNASTKSPGILKVIDEIPPNGYLDTWSKYARIVIGQEIDGSGNFINNKKAPYWTSYPNVELTGNGVSGSSGVHGYAKWDYAINSKYFHSWESYGGPYSASPIRWCIVGDDRTFYLLIWCRGTDYLPTVLGFGNYASENPEESSNLCLQARNSNLSASDRTGENFARTRNEFGVLDATFGGILLSNAAGKIGDIINGGTYKCEGLSVSSTEINRPWKASDIKSINPITGEWITSKLFIKDSDNYLRGYHRGVRIMYGKSRLNEGSLSLEGDFIINVQSPATSSDYESMPLLFSLRDWEYIE